MFGADRTAVRDQAGIDQFLDPVFGFGRKRLCAKQNVQIAIADMAEHDQLGALTQSRARADFQIADVAIHRHNRQADVERDRGRGIGEQRLDIVADRPDLCGLRRAGGNHRIDCNLLFQHFAHHGFEQGCVALGIGAAGLDNHITGMAAG